MVNNFNPMPLLAVLVTLLFFLMIGLIGAILEAIGIL